MVGASRRQALTRAGRGLGAWRAAGAAALAWGVLAAAQLAVPAGAHAATSFPEMCTDVASVAGGEPGVTTAVVVVDLETGDRCAINGDRSYRSASLYKLVVVAELYRQVEEGVVGLDDPLVVEPRHAIDDPPGLRITEAYTTTVAGAADRMITFSDNGTAFALRELLGLGQVADATGWLGMPATSLSGTFLTSANDQAAYLAQLYRGEIVSAEASQGIMDLMLRQQIVDMIPRGLPEDTRIAHKTGTLSTFLHDAGIVFAPGGDFVLVVMTENSSLSTALEVGQAVARTAYDAYAEPSGAASPVGEEAAALLSGRTGMDGLEEAIAAAEARAEVAVAGSQAAPPTVLLDERAAASPIAETLRQPPVLAGLLALAAAAILGPVTLLRRRTAVRYRGATLTRQDARLRADRSERGLVMRFGSRRDDEGRTQPVSPASRSVAEVVEQPVLPSRRLQRVAEHFRAQGELLASMRDQFEEEMEPLHELIVEQNQAMQALLQNLEERLRPLNEYADGEEANLTALEERIHAGGGQDHVARSFSNYLTEQRRRIDETREQIDQQRLPFLEYGEAQRETVETALQRFDGDIEALEANLAEQRRVMVRMLDAMRSETFVAVKGYLEGRQQALAELAATGTTDPVEISQATQKLRADVQALAVKSDHVRALLEQAEAGDRALSAAAPAPRPLREEPAPAPLNPEDGEVEEEATA